MWIVIFEVLVSVIPNKINKSWTKVQDLFMERKTRLELATTCLEGRDSSHWVTSASFYVLFVTLFFFNLKVLLRHKEVISVFFWQKCPNKKVLSAKIFLKKKSRTYWKKAKKRVLYNVNRFCLLAERMYLNNNFLSSGIK